MGMSSKQAFALTRFVVAVAAAFIAAAALAARGEAMLSVTNLNALRGLVSLTTLGNTEAGKAALASNFTITGDIQSGVAHQPLLLSFADQQQQALRDALITGVAYELADGLGSKLGVAYQKTISADCKTSIFTSKLPAVARLIGFANATSHADSDASKYFFANGTRDGRKPVSEEAKLILTDVRGTTDIFGRAYGPPVDSGKANPFGNSRPFQTEPHFTKYAGKDFCGSETTNTDSLKHLAANPAYPSGHTVYGYMESVLLALLVPERYQQMITRQGGEPRETPPGLD
jgi:hypothetical protein